MVFQKATKQKAKLRMALMGPSGSGKTYSALNIAQYLGKKVCVVDTEGNSASKYANLFDFCTLSLTDCHPNNFIKAIDAAVAEGFDVVIIDSLSAAYNGKNGLLELADREKMKLTNNFQAWAKVAPLQNALTQKLLTAPIHILATLRVKMAYDMQEENGKKKPVKVGLAPIQKEGIEYEFDILAEMTPGNMLIVSKTRCPELNDQTFDKPGKEVADILSQWLNDGVSPVMTAPIPEEKAAPTQQQPVAEPKPAPSAKTPEKAPLKLQTAPAKSAPEPVKKSEPTQEAGPFPNKGLFERVGILADIKSNGANKWELFLQGIPSALITFSQATNLQAVKLLGKNVKIKAVTNNPGQYILLNIAPAN